MEDVPLCFSDIEDASNLPIVTVWINVHFVKNASGQTFHPGIPGQPVLTDGNLAATQMKNKANEYFANFLPSPTSLSDFLGDSRIRFEFYSEPENEQDLYGGIWYWDTEPTTFPYGDKALDIIVVDENTSTDGKACGLGTLCSYLYLYDWYQKVLDNGQQNLHWDAAKFTMHELGHITGLCHSFDCNEDCASVDLNTELECNTPGYTCEDGGCGDKPDKCTEAYNGPSDNLMGYNPTQRSLTPCQWKKYYTALYYGLPEYVAIQSDCGPYSNTPVSIATGTTEEWDGIHVIEGNVTIEAGATLTISCLVYMAPNTNFIVRRGGKLVIWNAQVRRLCEEQPWGGIWVEGHNAKEQPAPDPNTPASSYPDTDIAGAVIMINSDILGGGHVFITRSFSAPDNPSYWGGLIYAENSGFWNNKRVAEFMRYNLPNKSQFINCDFEEVGDAIDGSAGISIWNCRDIEFVDNSFRNLDKYGIHGWDYGAKITSGNSFESVNRGIDIYNTFPLSSHVIQVGAQGETPNYFTDNAYSIIAESTDLLNGLFVYNNEFYNSVSSIYIDGEAAYEVKKNAFDITGNSIWAIRCDNTERYPGNAIECNFFQRYNLMAIMAVRDNSGLQIKYNDFNDPPSFGDIMLTGSATNLGRLRERQGAPGDPAANCFSSQTKAIFTSNQVTEHFTYYVPEAEENPPACFIPTSTGNYSVEQVVDFDPFDCLSNGEGELTPPFTLGALETKRQAMATAYQAWVADPENGQKEADYFQARLEKDIVLKWLLRSAIDSSQYTQAATILAGEPGPRAQRWKLGLKLLAEDYTGATAALQQLPQQTQAEQYFAYIMGVNIQRLQSEGNFTLSASQENQLLEIAHSESSYRSYARSLLNLLKGALFEPDEISFEEYEEQQPFQPPASSSALKYKIYPNPTHEQILIQYPYEEAQLILDVTAVTGTFSHRIKLDGSGSYALDTQTFTPGIYIIQILKDKRVVHLDRITIIH